MYGKGVFEYGGQSVHGSAFGAWVPVIPGGVAMPGAGGTVEINPSNSEFKQFVDSVRCKGYLVNVHAFRFRIYVGTTIAGGGTDARATELQAKCCFRLLQPRIPWQCEKYTDREYTFAQLSTEVNSIIAPQWNYLRVEDDPRAKLFQPEEFWPLRAGGGIANARGAYGQRSASSPHYRERYWNTSLNTFQIQRAAPGAETGDLFIDQVFPVCAYSGNPSHDCLPAEAFVDNNQQVVFSIRRAREILGTLIPAGGGAATDFSTNLEVTAYVTYTKIGDPRPVGVPWQLRQVPAGDQTNITLPTYPYVAVVHSAVYDDVATGDAPMTSILFSPRNYSGINLLQHRLFNGCNERVWPLFDNANYAVHRLLLSEWNRAAQMRTRWPNFDEPITQTAGTGAPAAIPSRWTRAGGLAGANAYDASDGRDLIRGFTADQYPHAVLAFNDFSADGFPRGWYDFKNRGQQYIRLQGFVLPNNAPDAAASVVLSTVAVAPDEQPGDRGTDRWKLFAYAAYGACGCERRMDAEASLVTPVLDSIMAGRGAAKLENLRAVVPAIVDTSKYPRG